MQKLKFNLIFVFCVAIFFQAPPFISAVYAQDEGGDFFDEDEDEGYDEPYVDPAEPPGQRGEPNNRDLRPPAQPGLPRQPIFNPPAPSANRNSGGVSSSGGLGAANDDAVQFKLVDPPKYWQPKKRKFRYKQQPQTEK